MAEQVKFIAYCAEIYKENKNLSGKKLGELFSKYDIWEYVYDCFAALHTTGALYTIECIDEFIDRRRAVG